MRKCWQKLRKKTRKRQTDNEFAHSSQCRNSEEKKRFLVKAVRRNHGRVPPNDEKGKIHKFPVLSLAHQPNPPFQPTRVDVCRVHSGSFRAGG